MEEHSDCTSGVCPGASANGETVSIYVPLNHPLLQLKRALPWDALSEVMERQWRRAGKNTDGRPGLPWDVALYVPLMVLMLVKHLNAREMEAYVSENVVARVFMGRQDDPQPPDSGSFQYRPGLCTALGKDGVEEVNALMLHVAHDRGFADASILSSDTTAQELPIGYPNEPGILRGWAQRCGRALATAQNPRGGGGRYGTRAGADDPQDGQRTPPVYQGQTGQAPGVDAPAHRGGPVDRAHPAHGAGAGREPRPCHATRSDHAVAMHEVAQRLIPQIVQWITTGVVAKGKIVHVGVTQARALVRHKAGKEVEFGLPYLLSRLGGGVYFWDLDPRRGGRVEDALAGAGGYRAIFGAHATPMLVVYDRGGYATTTLRALAHEGSSRLASSPKASGAWHVAEAVRETVRSERGKTEGIIGTLKTDKYGFNKPKERLWQTLEMAGPGLSSPSI